MMPDDYEKCQLRTPTVVLVPFSLIDNAVHLWAEPG